MKDEVKEEAYVASDSVCAAGELCDECGGVESADAGVGE